MGFINTGGPPPPRGSAEGLPSDEPPPDEGTADMAALSAAAVEAARAATARYRRQPEGIGRYAWAISLGLHAVALVGAYVAIRYYLPHTGRTTPPPAPASQGAEPDWIVISPDATDAVHGGWAAGIALAADPAFNTAGEQEIPSTIAREAQTILTFQNLKPRSAIHAPGDSGSTPWPLSPLPSSNASRR